MTLTRPESCDNLTAIRYLWRVSPCPLKKCYIYSTENYLPAPPFVLEIENEAYNSELHKEKSNETGKVDKNKISVGLSINYGSLVFLYSIFVVVTYSIH